MILTPEASKMERANAQGESWTIKKAERQRIDAFEL